MKTMAETDMMADAASPNALVEGLIAWPERTSSIFNDLGPLFARITIGYVFMMTGWTKLNSLYPNGDFPGMIARFGEWGIPFPQVMAPFASGVEFVGGILLMLGLFTRLAGTPLVIVMIVAIVSAKWDQIDSIETLFGFEEVAYMAIFGWLAIAGPGRISLDYLLRRVTGTPGSTTPRV